MINGGNLVIFTGAAPKSSSGCMRESNPFWRVLAEDRRLLDSSLRLGAVPTFE